MENDRLIIPIKIFETMINHGRSNLPFEACGILSGENNYAQSVWKLKNEKNSDRRFFVGKDTVLKTLQIIEQKEEQVLAIYHTHPTTAPSPSYYDIINHPDPEVKMLIISYKTQHPILQCYSIQKPLYKEYPFYIK